MQGSILNVGSDRSLILGDEGARYAFASSDWRSVDAKPEVGMRVDFETRGSDATDVYPLPITAARRVTYTDPTAKVSPPTEPTRKKPRLGKLLFVDKTIVVGMTVAILGMVLSAALLVYMLLNVEVPQVVRLVALVPSPGTVVLGDVGDTADLTAQGYYSDLSLEDLDPERISFESTNPSIVSVTPDGTVTAEAQGAADIVVRLGGTTERVHALVFGDIPTLPPIDPAMVGPIPDPELEIEVRAVLNRVIIELGPRYDEDDAADIADELGGEIIFSYRTFPGHVIEFDAATNALLDVIEDLGSDRQIEAAYPDILLELLGHPIDTLSVDSGQSVEERRTSAYHNAGFEGAWRMLEKVPKLYPVVVGMVEGGALNIDAPGQHAVITKEFDRRRVHSPPSSTTSSNHAAGVASVLAATNHQLQFNQSHPELEIGNLSGILSSVENLRYDLISMSIDPQFLSLADSLNQIEAIHSIQNRGSTAIDAVNFSYGNANAWTADFDYIFSLFGDHSSLVKNIIGDLPGVTFVAGAGNCEVEASNIFPAKLSIDPDFSNVMTVGGASRSYANRWSNDPDVCEGVRGRSSAYGNAVTIAAPAENVWAVDTYERDGYFGRSGTSFAAPMVTGAVALLKSIDQNANPRDLKDLLVETGDKKTICTSTPTALSTCPESDKEEWSFLRADKAVAQLLLDLVKAEVGDRVVVPVEENRVEGSFMVVGADIRNESEIVWPLHVEAYVARPDGQQIKLESESETLAVAAQSSHLFTGGFWAAQPGCWGMRVRVSMDNDPDSHLRKALAELAALSSPNHGLLADTGWINEVIEVRPAGAPDVALDCSGAANAVPLTLTDSTGPSQTAPGYNVMLLADTSGSMDGSKVTALKEAVRIFVDRARDIQVEAKAGSAPNPSLIGMVDFDSRYREVLSMQAIDPSDNSLSQWESAIRSLDADGGTALYDAVIRSVQLLESEGVPGKGNILIALTDGSDQDSSNSLRAAVEAIQGSTVTMYAVALSEPGGQGDYDFSVLEQMARAGRGSAFAAHTDNLDSVYELFTTIFAIQ